MPGFDQQTAIRLCKSTSHLRRLTSILALASFCPLISFAAVPQILELKARDADTGDSFGSSIAFHGSKILIGSRLDNDRGYDSGSAYVFNFNDGVWSEEAKLSPSDGEANGQFGTSLAIWSDWILVGAPQSEELGIRSGKAYFYRRALSRWRETQIVTAPGLKPYERFGFSADIDNRFAVIGAPGNERIGQSTGTVYVFSNSDGDWSYLTSLHPEPGSHRAGFGYSVSLEGDRLAVGAPADDCSGSNAGAAYVYRLRNDEWILESTLHSNDGASGDYFGNDVSIAGNRLLIGARKANISGLDSGAAYLFQLVDDQWIQSLKIVPVDGGSGDNFGASISLSGSKALVGSIGDDEAGIDAGAAYVYNVADDNIDLLRKIVPEQLERGSGFGGSVEQTGPFVFIGATTSELTGSTFIGSLESGSSPGIFALNQAVAADSQASLGSVFRKLIYANFFWMRSLSSMLTTVH